MSKTTGIPMQIVIFFFLFFQVLKLPLPQINVINIAIYYTIYPKK